MANPAAVLSILVEANTGAANASLAKTDAALRGTAAAGTRTTTATSKAGSAMRAMGTAAKIGGAALGIGFLVVAKKSVETTNELAKAQLTLHKTFGLTTQSAGEWAAVARTRGADTQKLGMAFKTLSTQISAAAHGSEESRKTLEMLGFSQKDIQKSLHDTDFAVTQVAKGFGDMPAGVDKATVASKLFGRGWQTIFPVLRDGNAAMQDQLETMDKYGSVLSGKALRAQEQLLAEQRESKAAWQGMQVTLGTALTPALIEVHDQFQRIAKIMADKRLTDDEKFRRIATLIEKDMGRALDVILKMIPIIASKVGERVPQIAMAFVQGFLDANIWGKLLLGSWLLGKFGGLGAFKKVGSLSGRTFGRAFVAGAVIGLALLAVEFREQIKDALGTWFKIAKKAGEQVGKILGSGIRFALNDVLVPALNFVIDRINNLITAFNALPGRDLPMIGAISKLGDVVETSAKSLKKLSDIGNKFLSTDVFGTLSDSLRPPASVFEWIDRAKAQYGSLGKAIGSLSNQGRKDFVKWAGAAHEAGKITNDSYSDIVKAAKNAADKTGRAGGDFRQSSDKTTDSVKRDSRDQQDAFKKSADVVDKSSKSQGRDVGDFKDAYHRAFQGVKADNLKLHPVWDSSADNVHDATKRMGKSVMGLANNVEKGEKNISENTNKSLKAFGAKEINFVLKHATLSGEPGFHQRGGVIEAALGRMVPGSTTGDTVPAMLEPGEVVINRRAVQKMGGADRVNQVNRMIPRFATGGTAGMQPNAAALASQYVRSFGGSISSGLRPGDPGFHGRGMAFDWVGGDWDAASRYSNRIGSQLLEGIHQAPPGSNVSWDSGSQVPPSFWGSATWAEHVSHIHIAVQNAITGAIGTAITKIMAPILKGPDGPLKDMGQTRLDKVTDAANAYIAKHMPKQGPGELAGTTFPADPGGWTRVGATYEGLDGQMGAYGIVGGMGFAELLQAGANAGAHPNLSDVLGYPGDMPPHTKVQFKMPGSNRAAIAEKNDIGSGQSSLHYLADIQTGLMNAIGWHPNEDVDVKRAMLGGIIQKFQTGGAIDTVSNLMHRWKKSFDLEERKHPRPHPEPRELTEKFIAEILAMNVPNNMALPINNLSELIEMDSDMAGRAATANPDHPFTKYAGRSTLQWLRKLLGESFNMDKQSKVAAIFADDKQVDINTMLAEVKAYVEKFQGELERLRKKKEDLNKQIKQKNERLDPLENEVHEVREAGRAAHKARQKWSDMRDEHGEDSQQAKDAKKELDDAQKAYDEVYDKNFKNRKDYIRSVNTKHHLQGQVEHLMNLRDEANEYLEQDSFFINQFQGADPAIGQTLLDQWTRLEGAGPRSGQYGGSSYADTVKTLEGVAGARGGLYGGDIGTIQDQIKEITNRAHPKKDWLKRLTGIGISAKNIAAMEESIGIATTVAGHADSPGGAEFAASELKDLIERNKGLRFSLFGEERSVKSLIDILTAAKPTVEGETATWITDHLATLGTTQQGLIGLTGQGGAIGDVQEVIHGYMEQLFNRPLTLKELTTNYANAAKISPPWDDDISWASQVVDWWSVKLDELIKEHASSNKITGASNAITRWQAILDAATDAKAGILPPLSLNELISRYTAAAAVSPPWEDDIAWATDIVSWWDEEMDKRIRGSAPAVSPYLGSILQAHDETAKWQAILDKASDAVSGTSPDTSDAITIDDSGLLDLLRQQLLATQQALIVSQAQYPVAASYAGMFAKGGIVQAQRGQPVPALVHGGEGVFTPDQMAAMGSGGDVRVVIHGDVVTDRAVEDAVDVYVGGRLKKDIHTELSSILSKSRR